MALVIGAGFLVPSSTVGDRRRRRHSQAIILNFGACPEVCIFDVTLNLTNIFDSGVRKLN